jgi:hypothetical protein
MEFDIDELLSFGKVPPQDQLLPAGFRSRVSLGETHQLGLVVPDVVESARRLEAAGIGPFFIAEDDLNFWIERGEPKFFHGKMGMAQFKGYELELLEAGRGSTFYSDGFDSRGRIALHHVGFLDHRMEDRIKQFNEAGIETAVRGRIKLGPLNLDFAYMDARKETGLYVEFIDQRFLSLPVGPATAMTGFAAKLLRLIGVKQIRMGRRD